VVIWAGPRHEAVLPPVDDFASVPVVPPLVPVDDPAMVELGRHVGQHWSLTLGAAGTPGAHVPTVKLFVLQKSIVHGVQPLQHGAGLVEVFEVK
jgi:hypothetical protein